MKREWLSGRVIQVIKSVLHALPILRSISLLAVVGLSLGQLMPSFTHHPSFLRTRELAANFLPRCTVRCASAHPSVLIGYRSNISLLGGGYPFSSPLVGWRRSSLSPYITGT